MTLRDLRVQAGKSVKEVASALGVASSSYYSYEHGSRTIDIRQVLILAAFYGITAEEIIEAQLRSGVKK